LQREYPLCKSQTHHFLAGPLHRGQLYLDQIRHLISWAFVTLLFFTADVIRNFHCYWLHPHSVLIWILYGNNSTYCQIILYVNDSPKSSYWKRGLTDFLGLWINSCWIPAMLSGVLSSFYWKYPSYCQHWSQSFKLVKYFVSGRTTWSLHPLKLYSKFMCKLNYTSIIAKYFTKNTHWLSSVTQTGIFVMYFSKWIQLKLKHLQKNMRFEVFTAVRIQVKVFWVVTPCRVVVGY